MRVASSDATIGPTLAQVAGVFETQPHEVAAFLNLENWETDSLVSPWDLAAFEAAQDFY